MQYVNRLILIGLLAQMAACSTPTVIPDSAKVPVTDGSQRQKSEKDAVDPNASVTYKLALTAIEQGNNKQAIAILTDMSTKFPQFSGPHANLGLIHFRDGDLTRAEAAFRQAISINPANATAHNHLGIIYRHGGRFSEAEKSYLSAIEQQPDYANAYLNLGILYDIYLLKLNKALHNYQKFQSLQQTEDSTVKKWIIGLQRRQKVSK